MIFFYYESKFNIKKMGGGVGWGARLVTLFYRKSKSKKNIFWGVPRGGRGGGRGGGD